jgi:hypothetical protein
MRSLLRSVTVTRRPPLALCRRAFSTTPWTVGIGKNAVGATQHDSTFDDHQKEVRGEGVEFDKAPVQSIHTDAWDDEAAASMGLFMGQRSPWRLQGLPWRLYRYKIK